MFCLIDFMLTPFYIETQHRNAILVYNIRIDLAEIIFPRYSFSTTSHTHTSAIKKAASSRELAAFLKR